MASSKYVDTTACIQVIGSLMKRQDLLDRGQYFFTENDFTNEFHRVVMGCLVNRHAVGIEHVTLQTISDYLADKPRSLAIYDGGGGPEWIETAVANADVDNFDFYYGRMKKMSLLRSLDAAGCDVTDIYDPDNILDPKAREAQERRLEEYTLSGIVDHVNMKIDNIRRECVDNTTGEATRIGSNLQELLEELKETPDVGYPFYGPYINTITRGMREKKLYIRSAATGVGKTRTMVADACYSACTQIYDSQKKEWVSAGIGINSLLISTELELSEVQTMCLAFVADVDEEKILNNTCSFEERDRLEYAADLLHEAPLFVEVIPDFSLKDIENIIKRNLSVNKCKLIFYDYIHTSMKILEEISRRSGGVKLREDNILFLLSVKLKDLCNEFSVSIISATQLNGDWKTSDMPDQNLLRGAKSIADKIDVGMILLDVTEDDREALKDLVEKSGTVMPNVKMSIYKNRRGSYNKCYLWMHANKSTCRFEGMFCTTYDYDLIPIKDTKLLVEK